MTKAAFTKAQVERAVSGALKAGLPVKAVEITQDGTIRIVPVDTFSVPKQGDPRQPEEW